MIITKPLRTDFTAIFVPNMKPPQADFTKDGAGRPVGVTGYKLLAVTETGNAVEYPCSSEIYARVERGGKYRTGMDTDPDSQYVLYVDSNSHVHSLDVIPEFKYQNTGFLRPADADEKKKLIVRVAADGSFTVTQRPYELNNPGLLSLLAALNTVESIQAGQSYCGGGFMVESIAGDTATFTVDPKKAGGADTYSDQESLLASATRGA